MSHSRKNWLCAAIFIAVFWTPLVNITGNTFSNLAGDALTLKGSPNRQIVFVANLLINCEGQQAALEDSRVGDNLVTTSESVKPKPSVLI